MPVTRSTAQTLATVAVTFCAGCSSHADPKPDAERDSTEAALTRTTEVHPSDPIAEPPALHLTRTPLVHKPFAGAIGELTGDGRPDVLALCHMPESAGLLLLRGAAEGGFVEHEPELVDGSGLALADLDGDDDLDALILDARGQPGYRVALNHGDGSFAIGPERRIRGHYGGELHGAAIADLDGDTKLDAVVPLWDSVRVLPGDGRGGFGPGFALAAGRDPYAVAVADLNDDGHQDLVVTSKSGPAQDDAYDPGGASAWIFLAASTRFAPPIRIEIPGASDVAIADLDTDGALEAVVSGAHGLTVIRGPWDAPTQASFRVVSDGPLVVADVLAAPGPELLTPSYMQSRLHVLAGYPDPRTTSVEAGSFVVGLFVARIEGVDRIVLLDAGPPGGPLGDPAPAIELLFLARGGLD